jgi:hypothetical protein
MGLLIFVWGIYTELQNCMYQTAHAPCLYDKVVSDLWQVSGFCQVIRFPPPIKLTATISLSLSLHVTKYSLKILTS